VNYYKQAIEYLKKAPKKNPETKQLKLACFLNLTKAELELELYQDAIFHVNLALDLDPHNVKGLYRRGLANLSTGKLLKAKSDFESALSIQPNDSIIANALADCEAKLLVNSNRPSPASRNQSKSQSQPKPATKKELPVNEPKKSTPAQTGKNSNASQPASKSSRGSLPENIADAEIDPQVKDYLSQLPSGFWGMFEQFQAMEARNGILPIDELERTVLGSRKSQCRAKKPSVALEDALQNPDFMNL
jgi:tetratricopeptide (TPR) repeat protein